MKRLLIFSFLFLPGTLSLPAVVHAADDIATVTLDGRELFRVRGVTGFSAAVRAEGIAHRIEAFASDKSASVDQIQVVHLEDRSNLMAGDVDLASVLDDDAAIEKAPRALLADRARMNIVEAVKAYREARSRSVLIRRSLMAAAATLGLILVLLGLIRLFKRFDAIAERHVKARMEKLEARSSRVIESAPLWVVVVKFIHTLRLIAIIAVLFFYFHFVLGLFPWTRPLSEQLLSLFVDPLKILARGFFHMAPKLAFLAVLTVLIRYVLKVTNLFFAAIDHGTLNFSGFDREWANPTYKIVRLLILAFGLVVAYPYIPGSQSEAFKGVSLFVGVVFSLGSSSFISNMIAGITLMYRRAFKIGDRIKIDNLLGEVLETRLQATYVRTYKNELVTIPNSVIVTSSVINYSKLCQDRGLILHTPVRVGYQASWRQVEALLLEAADRTPGLFKEPAPYVLQLELSQFFVDYELNAYCDQPHQLLHLYTAVHQNILDAFNEQGIQIMVPSYEGDPESPKIVPKDKWAPGLKGRAAKGIKS